MLESVEWLAFAGLGTEAGFVIQYGEWLVSKLLEACPCLVQVELDYGGRVSTFETKVSADGSSRQIVEEERSVPSRYSPFSTRFAL